MDIAVIIFLTTEQSKYVDLKIIIHAVAAVISSNRGGNRNPILKNPFGSVIWWVSQNCWPPKTTEKYILWQWKIKYFDQKKTLFKNPFFAPAAR